MSTLYTIGYEGLNVTEFIELLKTYDVDKLVDVRQLPISRKKGFSKNQLAQICDDAGISYEGVTKLGCPAEIRNSYKADGDWELYTERFLSYLSTQGDPIIELRRLVLRANCCLLCFEADENLCHRKYVAEKVALEIGPSATIFHIRKDSTVRRKQALSSVDK